MLQLGVLATHIKLRDEKSYFLSLLSKAEERVRTASKTSYACSASLLSPE
jgi:hypothetical protein